MKYVIAKYASMFDGCQPINKKIAEEVSIYGTYSAKMCGVTAIMYLGKVTAEKDLATLRKFNPSVDYGILEVED